MTLKNILTELGRELNMRDRVYRMWVSQGKMNHEKAEMQLEGLRIAIKYVTNGERPEGHIRDIILSELKRELDRRNVAYPRLIAEGKLNPKRAEIQNKRLESAMLLLSGHEIKKDDEQMSLF